jgi:glucuronosyltransferase
MKSIFFLCFVFSFFTRSVFAANILCIFPKPSYSHQAVFRGVTEELLEKGHKLTILSTHPSENERKHENSTLIDVSFSEKIFEELMNEIFEQKNPSWKTAMYSVVDMEAKVIKAQFESEEMKKLLKNKNLRFDVLLLETGGFSPYHALADHFAIPVVGITSADSNFVGHETMGNVMNPIAHPDRILPFTVARKFSERLFSCFFVVLIKFLVVPRAAENYEPLAKKYFPENTKNYYELTSNVDLQLINAHPALGFIRPLLPNTIPLGFLHVKPPKPLPSDLQEILDTSKQGVIYMSFGTLIRDKMYKKNYTNFIEAFSDLPYVILWKTDDPIHHSLPSNVISRKWFPQSDLLAHPHVKLFITHGVS